MEFFNYKLCLLFAYLVSVYSQSLYFTQQPEAVYYAHNTVQFVIQCRSTGTKIVYRRSDAPMYTASSNESFTRPIPVEGVDGSDAGVIWDCLSSDENGVIVSSIAIVYWAKFVDSSTVGETEVTLLNTVAAYLPCDFFNESLPAPVISWEKRGNSIANAKILAGSNSLLLVPSDAIDGDTYRCFIENRFGDPSERVQANQSYIISVITTDSFSIPPLVYPNSDFTSTIGDSIYFECVGYTQNCDWQHRVSDVWIDIPTDNSRFPGVELSVTVTSDMPTEYRLILAGVALTTRTLTIYEVPRVVSSIKGELVEHEQQTITISCIRYGLPDPSVVLYHGSVQEGDQAGKTTFTTVGNTTTLEIQNLDSLDAGYYTCRAANSEASAVASGRIIVRTANSHYGCSAGVGAVGIVGVTTIAGALLAPVVLPLIGFTSAGIAAGSIAASIQGPAIAAGSSFAIAQSIGATGAVACAVAGAQAGAVIGVTGVAVGAAVGGACAAGGGTGAAGGGTGADTETIAADPETTAADTETIAADPETTAADTETTGANAETTGADTESTAADTETTGADI